ncbi:MAG: hypothetical protein ACRC0A_07065, partial [Chitinophagaceae bacterium]
YRSGYKNLKTIKNKILMKSKMIQITSKNFGSPIIGRYKRTRINWSAIIVWSVIALIVISSLLSGVLTLISKFNK